MSIFRRCLKPLHLVGKRLLQLSDATQPKWHGRYPAHRVLAQHEFSTSKSLWQAMVVFFASLLPSLMVITLLSSRN